MNVEMILQLVEPYVKDASLTYDEFDGIFNILSMKEQYEVVNILYEHGLKLVDNSKELEIDFLDHEESDEFDAEDSEEEVFVPKYNNAVFQDYYDENGEIEYLQINKDIKQSNENLCGLIQKGNQQAVQDLCIKNKRLVDKYVVGFEKKYHTRLEFDDLEQVGFLGLIKAAEKFDLSAGTSFSTYAVFWIKQAIAREIMDCGYIIRVPVHMHERINKVLSIHSKCISLGMNESEALSWIEEETGLEEEQIKECLKIKHSMLTCSSLDTPIGEDGDSELVDFIPDCSQDSIESSIYKILCREEIEKLLLCLKEKELAVIRQRFGLDDNIPKTLEEIGTKYNLTRERIRQIEVKALRKLRNPIRSGKLKQYLEDY